MVIQRYFWKIVLFFSLCILSSALISALGFNGTVLDVNGNVLNNSLINITIRNSDFSINGSNSSTSNASGWFNFAVADVANAFYEVQLTWTNTSTGATEWVGQNMPPLPSMMLQQIAGTTFYLREAGTINITAINSTGDAISFRYQIKDQALGYPISEEFTASVSSAMVVVPRDRSYSLMVYPDQSMPVSFNWNNFSASSSYSINSLSRYNATTKMLNYKFNTTMSLVQVSGYLHYPGVGVSQWSEFTVVPYLLEPGNMVHAEYGDLPYNISAMFGYGDVFNAANGFYNLTLPSTPAETSAMLLFVTARNGSTYYGGFRNISNLGNGLTNFNFTSMAVLLGSSANISMDTVTGGSVNIPTLKQTFNIKNSSNAFMDDINAHIEVTLDYSSLQAQEFTWMLDIQQGSNSVFSVPLLGSTGVKEINVFASGGSGDIAPKRKSYTLSQLQTSQNITLESFAPEDIDGGQLSGLRVALLKSSSACDVPNPAAECYVGSNEGGQAFGEAGGFDPMRAVLGGGKLSFRMGLLSSGIIVHYVNVDMLASGPPDALFDDSVTSDSSNGFDAAMRFGSNGPTIYDYVLVSMPYTETAGSGLNDSSPVNISIPVLYDDDWNVIWNTSMNGTNAAVLGSNYSHYAARQSEWAYLLNSTECSTNQSLLSITTPCYLDTTNNRVWIRLPHFSGAGPSVSGTTVPAAASPSPSPSGGGGGGGGGGSSKKRSNAVVTPSVQQSPSVSIPSNPPAYEVSSAEESRPLDSSSGTSAVDSNADVQQAGSEADSLNEESTLEAITGMATINDGGELKLKPAWVLGFLLLGFVVLAGSILWARRR
ncbi:hypothetical protein HYS47_02280 [Candidatus Woesearchaeota archaeon]|nr:hypothetical protein [Candidatus Woesearchaeota archaeon]